LPFYLERILVVRRIERLYNALAAHGRSAEISVDIFLDVYGRRRDRFPAIGIAARVKNASAPFECYSLRLRCAVAPALKRRLQYRPRTLSNALAHPATRVSEIDVAQFIVPRNTNRVERATTSVHAAACALLRQSMRVVAMEIGVIAKFRTCTSRI
jgi:hypothetical protein